MKTDGIIFDKDGTLMDFDAFWVSLSEAALREVLSAYDRVHLLGAALRAFGVQDGVADRDGMLCKGTYAQMGEAVCQILRESGCECENGQVTRQAIDAYEKHAEAGKVVPVCDDLRGELLRLKAAGVRMAVVTTDNAVLTEGCLRKLNILDLFDEIYTDDGATPVKPDPYCAAAFREKYGLKHMMMVGDTLTDVLFARNAGIGVIGVAKTPQGKALLSTADQVLPDVSYLWEALC